MHKSSSGKRRLPTAARIALLALMDIALAAIVLCIFAYFHHVRPRDEVAIGTTSSRASMVRTAVTAEPEATPASISEPQGETVSESATVEPLLTLAPTVEPTAAPDPVGYFGTKFADKFTDGELIETEWDNGFASYQNGYTNITVTRHEAHDLRYYVADIYIKDISCLRSVFASNRYGIGNREWPARLAKKNDAILAINGDFYGARYEGSVIRNGVLYRDRPFGDLCFLYWDGTMTTEPINGTTATEAIENGAYQCWSFGPSLLDKDGKAISKFESAVENGNPRTAIGYFEPGHYCFVVVEGRNKYSDGLTLQELSALMESLGCSVAYNMDGGATSSIVWKGSQINRAANGGRTCSDIIMIGAPQEQ